MLRAILPSRLTTMRKTLRCIALGMFLEKRKGPVETFIVESVNKVPTEN